MAFTTFLDLPAELRLEIYRLVSSTKRRPLRVIASRPKKGRKRRSKGQLLFELLKGDKRDNANFFALARISKAMRQEILAVFLTVNTFVFQNTTVVCDFLDHFSWMRHGIRRIAIHSDWHIDSGQRLLRTIQDMPQLKELQLPVDFLRRRYSEEGNGRLRKFCQSLENSWIDTNGGVDAGLESLFNLHHVDVYKCYFCQGRKRLKSCRNPPRCNTVWDPAYNEVKKATYEFFNRRQSWSRLRPARQ